MHDMNNEYHDYNDLHEDKRATTDQGYLGGRGNQYYPLGDEHAVPTGGVVYTDSPRKRSCLDKLCCGCCTCFPRWMRTICCILFLIIVALAIVIGVLAALFKVPDVKFNGLSGEPSFNLTGTSANFMFNLNITVDNKNVEGITFNEITAEVKSEREARKRDIGKRSLRFLFRQCAQPW